MHNEATRKYLVVGAGPIGRAILHDLLQNPATEKVTMMDNGLRCHYLAAEQAGSEGQSRLRTYGRNVNQAPDEEMRTFISDADVVIGAAPHEMNVRLTRLCLEVGRDFCDTGTNDAVMQMQFAMHEQAKAKGARVFPGCGVAPGAVNVLTRLALDALGNADALKIRVGGLPQRHVSSHGHVKTSSVHGLIDGYSEPAVAARGGRLIPVPVLDGIEPVYFGDEIGMLYAAYASGGMSTLPQTYLTHCADLDFKALRYAGHWEFMRQLRDLGFFNDHVERSHHSPRKMTEAVLDANLPTDDPDVVVLRIEASVWGGDSLSIEMVDRADPVTKLSAMQRCAGFSASIVAQMLAAGTLHLKEDGGVLTHEKSIPPERFLAEWAARGLKPVFKRSSHPRAVGAK